MFKHIAIYGGSFDPIHNGHLAVADAVRQQLKPDLFMWIPAGHAPHKLAQAPTSGDARCVLIELAIANRSDEILNRAEVERQGPSYTVDTLEELQQQNPAARLSLVLGGDSQSHLPSWRNLPRIKELVDFVFVPRRNWETVIWEGGGQMLEMPLVDIEATAIRQALSTNSECTDKLPKTVLAEIKRRKLYQT